MAVSYEQFLAAYNAEQVRIEGQITNLTGKQKREQQRIMAAQRTRLNKFRASEAKRKEVHEERDLAREVKEGFRHDFVE